MRLFSARARIDAGRCCAYNGFLGLLLLGGAVALRLSGPPDPTIHDDATSPSATARARL